MTLQNSKLLSRLLAPKSLVVVGGDSAEMVARQCQRIGFSGDLFAVNPKRESLAGITCHASLDTLPVAPDAAFIGVSPARTLEFVEEFSRMGGGGAVCYASGFAEAGVEGESLQHQLVQNANGMPLVGPNCHGFINYLDGVALWPDHFGGGRSSTGPALLIQSGNIGINVTFQQRELGLSYVVAMGNNAALEVHDYVNALLDDPRVTAIGLHLEGLSNIEAFSRAAIRALKLKVPLVAIKSGSSDLGAEMALSHTRSLANPDNLVSLLFERYGIARCESLPEFLETLKFVSIGGALMSGEAVSKIEVSSSRAVPCIASMSCSGGEASYFADLVAPLALRFPSLSKETTNALSSILGSRVYVSNPLDYHTYAWGDLDTLTQAFTAMLSEPLDCALLILDYPPPEEYDIAQWQVAEQALCAASKATGTRIAIVSSLPENFPSSARARLATLGVAPMQGLKECAQALAHAGVIGNAQLEVKHLTPLPACSMHPWPKSNEGTVLDELASKQALATYVPGVPESESCHPDDAAMVATRTGFPVVIKALGKQLAHKTELNAVRLNVSSEANAQSHAQELGLISSTLLIEPMVTDAVVELLVGITCDPEFGQVLVIGAGGIEVELKKDTVQLLLPVSNQHIRDALLSLRIGQLFSGFRGGPAADLDAAVAAIQGVCEYAQANRNKLLELDINPLLVRPTVVAATDEMARDSTGAQRSADEPARAVVADALIRNAS